MQDAENTSAVFGLNWLQDMDPFEVIGTYDPEQELWIAGGPAEALGTVTTVHTLTGTIQDTSSVTTRSDGTGDNDFDHGDGDDETAGDQDNRDPFQP